MKRGRITQKECKLQNFWMPQEWVDPLDVGVRRLDTDRSKFIRTAIREKLQRHGVVVPEHAV